MKKNWTLRVCLLLLALTLMTSCVVGSTFAKYVVGADGTDSARVAKFGVAITANGSTFAQAYDTHDAAVAAVFAQSVESTDKVVAPGTSGNMVSMTLTGTPEVAVRVSYKADLALSSNWTVDNVFYCPIRIIIQCGDYSGNVCGLNYTSAADFEAEVEGVIAAYCAADYEAGTDLSTVSADSLSISWEWDFSTSPENDAKDTWLGNQAAAGNAATIALGITTTVTQID